MKTCPVSWSWVPAHKVIEWHARLIECFGGAEGLRDEGLLAGALARPQNIVAYRQGEVALEVLAAAYAVGLAKSHAFFDGNKRIAFAVMVAFLKVHGFRLDARESEASQVMQGVASSRVDEEALGLWISSHCIKPSWCEE